MTRGPRRLFAAVAGLAVFATLAVGAPATPPAAAAANLGAWSLSGPEGGSVVTIVFDPANPRRMYAGTHRGNVFWSADAGANWHASEGGDRQVTWTDVLVHPRNPDVIFGASGNGFHRSDDRGRTWSDRMNTVGNDFKSLASLAMVGKTLYAGTWQHNDHSYLAASTDNGQTWRRVHTFNGDGVADLLATPERTMYAARSARGLFASTDEGETWAAVSEVPGTRAPSVLTRGHDGDVYAGGRGGVSHFDSQTGQWRFIGTGLPRAAGGWWQDVTAVAVHPADASNVVIAYGGGLYRLDTTTQAWVPTGSGIRPGTAHTVVFDRDQPDRMFLGTVRGAGILRSLNGGETWNESNAGMYASEATDIAVDPRDRRHMYATTANGLMESPDGGVTWQRVDEFGTDHLTAVAFDPTDPKRLYIGGVYNVYATSDDAKTWTTLVQPAHAGGVWFVYDLLVDSGGTVWVGDNYGYVSWSSNTGGTWQSANVQTDTVRHIGERTSASGARVITVAGYYGISESRDGGSTWQSLDAGLPLFDHVDRPYIEGFAVDTRGAGTVYITAGDGRGLYRRTGDGKWETLSLDGMQTLAIDPVRPDTMYAGSYYGELFRSTDGGQTWRRIGMLPEFANVNVLATDGGAGARVLVGTVLGVYWSGPASPPQQVVAAAGDGLALVTWSPPAFNGSSPITSYRLRVHDLATGAISTLRVTGTAELVTGLTNGTPYRFDVSAVNTTAASLYSDKTNVVVPTAGAPLPEGAAELLDAHGGAVSTGEAEETDSYDQVSTTIDADVEGGTSIAEGAITDDPPDGETFVGQEVEVLSPDTVTFEPLEQVFTLDASQVPEKPSTMDVYRSENGGPSELVEQCTGPAGVAEPNPCLASRTLLPTGDLSFTVLTTHNTVWRFAAPRAVAGPPLEVVKRGTGRGVVTGAGGRIRCGRRCGAMLPKGTTTTLRALPAAGHTFAGWTGPCSGRGPCSVTMRAARRVGAVFMAPGSVAAMSSYFSPAMIESSVGRSVSWRGISGRHTVTDPTKLALFDAPLRAGSRWAYTFPSAGRYPFRSTAAGDPRSMAGVVSVPLQSSDTSLATGRTAMLRWAPSTRPSWASTQVQYRFKAVNGAWSSWKSPNGVLSSRTAVGAAFAPQRAGRYGFRARLIRTSGTSAVAGQWSNPLEIAVR